MGIRCLQRPDPGRSALGQGHIEWVSGMTTMGLRGVLACAFIVSSGLLTGLAATPAGASASQFVPSSDGAPAAARPGLIERIKLKACHVSLAATQSDRGSSRDRSRQCGA